MLAGNEIIKEGGIVSIGVIDFDCQEKNRFLQHSVARVKLWMELRG
jgi:hypothetical protein